MLKKIIPKNTKKIEEEKDRSRSSTSPLAAVQNEMQTKQFQ